MNLYQNVRDRCFDSEDKRALWLCFAPLLSEQELSDFNAAMTDGAADKLLVGADAIHIGRVEQGDAAIKREIDCRQRFCFVTGLVKFVHPDAAEAKCRNFEPLEPELDTRNNRDFGRMMIRSVFEEVSVGI